MKKLLLLSLVTLLACQPDDPPAPTTPPSNNSTRMQLLTAHTWELDYMTDANNNILPAIPSNFTERYYTDGTKYFTMNNGSNTGGWYFYSSEDSIQLTDYTNSSSHKRGIITLTTTDYAYQDAHGNKYFLIAQ